MQQLASFALHQCCSTKQFFPHGVGTMGYQRNDSFSMTLVTFIFGVMIFMLDAQCFNPMLPKSSTLGCHQRNGSLFDSKNTPTRIATHRRNSAFTGKSHRIHDEDKRNRSLFEYMALTKNSSFVQFVSPPAYSIKVGRRKTDNLPLIISFSLLKTYNLDALVHFFLKQHQLDLAT